MTVQSSTSRADYDGNGVTVEFTVPFRFLRNEDLLVLRTDVNTNLVTTLVLDSIGVDGYTVSGAGTPNGGSIHVVTAPTGAPSLQKLAILRSVQITQQTDYLANDPFPAESHERALDKLTMIVQQQAESISRSVTLPPQSVGVSTQLPGAQSLAPLVWSADETRLENGNPFGTGDMLLRPDLASNDNGKGSSLVSFIQSGVGAISRTAHEKLKDVINAKDFGVVADGVANDTSAIANAISAARSNSVPLYLPAGTIKVTSPIDISGVTLIGASKEYRNAGGTIIQGSGSHDVLVQATAASADTVIGLHNLRIKNGLCGVKVRYMLHSHWSNVHITDCADGIQFGNSSDAGGLFNTFDNIEVVVTGTALDVNGNGFVNANSFNQCYFSGDQYGARVRCNGGIGAANNVFNCCEFLGARYGVELNNTKNSSFNECYFESLGPGILLNGFNLGWNADDCVYAGLLNTNITGRNAFIYHVAGSVNRGSVKGGYVYIPSGATHNNLSFFASEDNANFFLVVADEPDQEISATGFVLYNNLNSANISITSTGTYTPTWTGSGGNPSLGNGTLTGRYARAGNVVTVTINLVMGGTTTFGSGVWSFGLPFAANAQWAGDAWMRDVGTSFFTGLFLVGAGSSSGSIYFNNSANNAGPSQPFVWASGDELTISITYRC